MTLSKLLAPVLLAAAALAHSPAHAYSLKKAERETEGMFAPGSQTVAATGKIEVAFSPNEGSEALVIKAIDAAKTQIRALSYSFTSAPITEAFLRARKRGIDVALLADYKANVSDNRSGKARAALSALVNAGIPVRTISVYPIHHDKTMIIDGRTVETGSFNYSAAAARKNSENVMVLWDNPDLAAIYLKHWERNWRQGQDFRMAY